MADKPIRVSCAAGLETGFMPLILQERAKAPRAPCCAAYRPGEIDKKLGRLIDPIGRPAKNGDAA
jgi:hypothetical protein